MSATVTVAIDGSPVVVPAGVTIAAALLAAGRVVLGQRPRASRARGVFCGMGVCHDCAVRVDGVAGIRACVTEVQDGMRVELGG
jgi:predicted molibdopterin-dependent oxidoreductase YjgC